MASFESFQQSVDLSNVFIRAQNNPPYYLYLNFTNKFIGIHSHLSQYVPPNAPKNVVPQIFGETDNGFWYGPFSSYSEALALAIIISDLHHRNYGEYINIINAGGINYPNSRPR